MKVKVDELLNAITHVKPALASKDIVPELTHFIFDGSMISAYDDQISISYPFETEETFTVKGSDFFNIISKLDKEKEVTITKEDDKLKIKQGSRSATFALTDGEFLNEYIDNLYQAADAEFEPLPGDFIDGLSMCYPCASGDASSGILCCVMIEGDRVVASDRNRIGMYKLMTAIDKTIIVKASAVHKLVNYAITHYHVSENWVHFMTESDSLFHIRLVEPEEGFPDFNYLIEETDQSKNIIPLPDKIKDMIDFTTIMSEDDVYYRRAYMTLKDGKLIVKCETKERGSATARIKLKKAPKKEYSFVINPVFLLYAVGLTKTLKFGEGRVLLQAGPFNYLIALFGESDD